MATGDWIILDTGHLAADRRREHRSGDRARGRYLADPIARAAVRQSALDFVFGPQRHGWPAWMIEADGRHGR